MDNNRKTVNISSSRAVRPSSVGRSNAAGSTQRRSSARPASARPASAKPSVRRSNGTPQKPAPQKKQKKGFNVQTAIIIAVVAVIVICVPLILLTTSSVNNSKELPQEKENILIAPATAIPSENSTIETEDPTADPGSEGTDTPVEKIYQRNDKDPEVARIQQRLMELGYMPKDEPTELFGPATEDSVKLFQTMNDLDSNGIADTDTQESLFSEQAKSFILEEGMENIAVSQLQSELRDLGYLDSNSTAYYGTATVNAVKRFQQQNGLDIDGKVGISTWKKVFSSSAVKAPEPTDAPEATTAPEEAPNTETE